MAQNPLDAIAPVQGAATLDDIAPISLDDIAPVTRRKKGVLDHLFTPIPALAKAGHKAAETIEGVKRPQPELPTEAPGVGELLANFVTGPIRGIRDAVSALPGAVSAFLEEPQAAARGFAAGTVETLSQSTPVDLITTLLGAPKAARSTASVGRGVKSKAGQIAERIRDPQTAGFKRASGSAVGAVKQSLPDVMAGTVAPKEQLLNTKTGNTRRAIANEKIPIGDRNPGWLGQMLAEVRQELDATPVNQAERSSGLPSPEDPRRPVIGSRSEPDITKPTTSTSPPIPDPGGDVNAAYESGRKATVVAGKRFAQLKQEKESLATMAEALKAERATRKTEIDAAAAATLPKSKAPAASIVERSEKLAAEVQKGLEEEGRPPKSEPLPVPPADIQAAVVETLTAAKPATAAAAGGGTIAGKVGTGTGATVTPPATSTSNAAVALPKIKATGKKVTENRLALTTRLKTAVDEAATVEAAAALRDKYMREAGAKGLTPERAQILNNAARLASIKVNELVKAQTRVAPISTAAPSAPTPTGVPVQRFDIQGRPVDAAAPVLAPRSPLSSSAPPAATVEAPRAPRVEATPSPVAPLQNRAGMKSLSEFLGMTPEEFRSLPRNGQKSFLDKYAEYTKEFEEGRTSLVEEPPDVTAAIRNEDVLPPEMRDIVPPAEAPPPSSVGAAPDPQSAALVQMADEAGAGPPPPGVDPVLHANMFALGHEAAAQFKARGTLDPRAVDTLRRYHGSAKTAEILGIDRARVEKISGAPHKRRPMVQVMGEMDSRFKFLMDDPKGFMKNEAMIAAAGGAAGALVGGMIDGEDALEKAAWVISGALMGSGAAVLGMRGRSKGAAQQKAKTNTALNQLAELDTANLLLGPAMIKTSLGSVSGVGAAYWELVEQGKYRQARAMAQYIKHEAAGDYWKQLTAPVDKLPRVGLYTQAMARKAGIKPSKWDRGVKNISGFVLRPFIAGDVVGSKALARGGFSKAEAQRFMMVGEPTTWQGQSALKIFESNLAFRLLAKFPRVRINALERGVEYTPGLGHLVKMRHKKGQSAFARDLKEQEGLSKAQLSARAKFGATAMVLGGAYGYYGDPDLASAGLVASVSGPAFVPTAAAMAAGKALRKKGPISSLSDALINVSTQIPQIGEADLNPNRLAQRLTPGRPLLRALERMFGEDK